VGAITQTRDRIIIAEKDCIGCKTCLMACPFGAIDFVPIYENGEAAIQNGLQVEIEDRMLEKQMVVASKCDLCAGYDGGPACVMACPEKALEMIVPKAQKKKRNIDAAMNLLESVKRYNG
jgi:electron transport protein HydN